MPLDKPPLADEVIAKIENGSPRERGSTAPTAQPLSELVAWVHRANRDADELTQGAPSFRPATGADAAGPPVRKIETEISCFMERQRGIAGRDQPA